MRDVRFARFVVLINCAVPGTLIVWDAYHHQLGANPVNFALLTTGMLTLIFLSLSLLITPVRKITGWNSLIFFRRTLGLCAFFHASAHFLIFFLLDRSMSLMSTAAEMVKRPYLVIGSLGLACMVPMAVTSTNGMIKRLGAKRWHLLHRLAYVAAISGVIHFYMQAKADKRKPIAFVVSVVILLGYRLVVFMIDQQMKTAIASAAVPTVTLRPKYWTGQLRVARLIQETPTVRTFRLQALDGGDLPFEYLPGQYLNLALLIGGKKVNRSYTIASSPTRPATCELTIKREDAGLASRHLHDSVHEGDLLQLSAPSGRFTFSDIETGGIVLIGGGVGITPLMSILRALTDRRWAGEIYLVYCVSQENEIIYAQELKLLQKEHKNLHLCVTVSRPIDGNWLGHRGRITEALLVREVPDLPHRLFYICGPSPMMSSIKELLRGLGVPDYRIRTEAFFHAKQETAATTSVPMSTEDLDGGADRLQAGTMVNASVGAIPEVTFAVSHKTVRLLEGQTLLDAGEEAGLHLEFECRSGICGKCKKRMLTGSVKMEVEDALSQMDKADQMILLCQARATQSVTVEA